MTVSALTRPPVPGCLVTVKLPSSAISAIFVAPAVFAGYHAVHGIVKHTMPSETWQIVFSVVGAIAVGITAFLRIAGMAAPVPANQGLARA